ncbi:MAG: glycosyltransferase [Proteobacteria bacterium]|nr:glycosyltransferase [Pseudomonadota bacterium]
MTPGLSLYWDGYGLSAAASGVYVHARNIATGLNLLGAPPAVIGPKGSSALFSDLVVSELLGPASLTSLAKLKPVWPQLVGQRVARMSIGRPYVLHGLSNFNLPTLGKDRFRRHVLTVHDLIPFLATDGVSRALRLQLAWLMPRALRRADLVVCVSQWTRRTLLERYPFVADRCHVIPNGIDNLSTPRGAWRATGADTIEVLYVARFEPYKQHALLLEVVRSSSLPLRLTLVTDVTGIRTCQKLAPDLIQSGRLHFKSNLTQAQIADVHASSDIYLSPSLYEGFCLPAASSLVAGKPVVYLAGSGIDEVVGASVGVPIPRGSDLAAWDEAIVKGLALAQGPDYEVRLTQHLASMVTWSDAAKRLLSLYHCLV